MRIPHRAIATVVIALACIGFARPVFAVVSVTTTVQPRIPTQHATVEARVNIDTDGAAINAIEGTIVYSNPLLHLERVLTGSSLVSMWVERPQTEPAGRVRFAGIVPGGYTGNNGELFTLVFNAVHTGSATITFDDLHILANDGEGSELAVRHPTARIVINEGRTGLEPETIDALERDTLPPELFTLTIARDPNIFDGKWFLSFIAQDKGTGVAQYEVQEHLLWTKPATGSWKSTESPYLLHDQWRLRTVSIRATDHAGNTRVVSQSSPRLLTLILVILAALILLTTYIATRNRRRS
ncbi:MAG: cohesin domain-containing protein [Candidatus Uhrbacteria bacterium]